MMGKLECREKTVDILNNLFWTVQPPIGIISGDYYRAENWFAPHFSGDQGYHGILEVVQKDGKICLVEFNEINSLSYYIQMYQGISKRLSNYCFFQATKERTAHTGVVLVNGLKFLEDQMIKENRLTGDFDLITGASNSIKRSMLPLAEDISKKLKEPTNEKYFGIAEFLGGGITGRLQVITKDKRIRNCFYDEIFADRKEEIEDVELKPYYRQSKYYSLDYVSTIGVGFNTIVDMLNEHVKNVQDLMDLDGLPFTTGPNYASEWDNYLKLAKKLSYFMSNTQSI